MQRYLLEKIEGLGAFQKSDRHVSYCFSLPRRTPPLLPVCTGGARYRCTFQALVWTRRRIEDKRERDTQTDKKRERWKKRRRGREGKRCGKGGERNGRKERYYVRFTGKKIKSLSGWIKLSNEKQASYFPFFFFRLAHKVLSLVYELPLLLRCNTRIVTSHRNSINRGFTVSPNVSRFPRR